jgi:hypothetical protein
MRVSKSYQLAALWEERKQAAPENDLQAIRYWTEQTAFWAHVIALQTANNANNEGGKARREQKALDGVPSNRTRIYYGIEIIPQYPARIDNIYSKRPPENSYTGDMHTIRAGNIIDAKKALEKRLNDERRQDPKYNPMAGVPNGR